MSGWPALGAPIGTPGHLAVRQRLLAHTMMPVVIRFENTPTVLLLTIAPGVSQAAETYLEPAIFELNPNVLSIKFQFGFSDTHECPAMASHGIQVIVCFVFQDEATVRPQGPG